MQAEGAQVNDVADRKPFQAAVKPVWDKYGAQHAALIQRVHADGSQNVENIAAFDPATKLMVAVPVTAGPDTLYLQLYGTGIRYVPDQSLVTCTIGGRAATVLYAGIAPGYFGLDQVNIRIPDGLTGVVNIVVTVDGQVANTVTMTLK
jgi:uncharacterized protein (TIGR03437 family)